MWSEKRKPGSESVRGAVLIEIAISIPFLLIVIFGSLWASTFLHARVAVDSGLDAAIRLASTRAHPFINSADPLLLSEWTRSEGVQNSDTAKKLLSSTDALREDSFNQYRNEMIRNGFGSGEWSQTELWQLPTTYVETILYAEHAIKSSIGEGSVRFPCDPEGVDGDGCLICAPYPPGSFADLIGKNTLNDKEQKEATDLSVAIACRYRPPSRILSPLLSMINAVSSGSIDTTTYFTVLSSRFQTLLGAQAVNSPLKS